MCPSTYAFGALLAVYTVLAAPAPEPFKTGWDKPVDPDRDCKFVTKGSSLTIELPGTDHDLAPKRHRFNAPRLLRDVDGDFIMQVRVSAVFHTSAESSVAGEASSVAAGLVLIPDKEKCIRLEYGAFRHKGKQYHNVNFRIRGKGYVGLEAGRGKVPWKEVQKAKEEQIYLRLERRGDHIYQFISLDGEKWIDDFNVGLGNPPKKLKVGLAAFSTSTEPFKVAFDQFKLTRSQKKKP